MSGGQSPGQVDKLVTLQISIVCEIDQDSESKRAAAIELLQTMAEEVQMRLLLISNRMPIGETMHRSGLGVPVIRKIEVSDKRSNQT
jgi:hypothetical protein